MANPGDYKSFVERYEEALRRQPDSILPNPTRAEANRANAQAQASSATISRLWH